MKMIMGGPISKNETMKNFKSIGIRARVAYGILCLENCIATINIRNTQLDWLIESLWEYTFTRELYES